MKTLLATVFVATAIAAPTAIPPAAPPSPSNWCKVGHTVMIPDGREGPVTSLDGDICQVLVYGETYASQWVYYLIEPVDPKNRMIAPLAIKSLLPDSSLGQRVFPENWRP